MTSGTSVRRVLAGAGVSIGLSVAAAGQIADEQVVAALREHVEALAARDAFSGTVLLARGDEVLFEGAWGLATKRFGVPNEIDTKFNLGSMNKMFTAVSILQLVQEGDLSLDDSLADYVGEDWLPAEVTRPIRIRHLLTHTSGLGSYFNDVFMQSSRLLFRELDDYKPLVAGETREFEPGTAWRYSNTGMFLLGVVIEKVTGESYFDYVREHVYGPAGMEDSDCFDMDRPIENLAIGYSREDRGDGLDWTNNLYMHVVRGGPAGGGFSTVHDLHAFDRALRGHALLDAEHTAMLWEPHPELGSLEYGFGFGLSGEPGDRIVGHGGGFPGISAKLDMYLDSGYTVAVLSNYDGAAAEVAEWIRELLRASR